MKRSPFIAVILLLAGCEVSRVPLSSALINKYQLTPQELQSLQVYVVNDYAPFSEAIRLYEAKQKEKEKVAKAQLTIQEKRYSEDYIIPQNTYCIITNVSGDNMERVEVRCDENDPRSLLFGKISGQYKDYYYLYTINREGKTLTRFGDTLVEVTPSSAYAYLKVEVRKVEKSKKKQKIAKGIKVK